MNEEEYHKRGVGYPTPLQPQQGPGGPCYYANGGGGVGSSSSRYSSSNGLYDYSENYWKNQELWEYYGAQRAQGHYAAPVSSGGTPLLNDRRNSSTSGGPMSASFHAGTGSKYGSNNWLNGSNDYGYGSSGGGGGSANYASLRKRPGVYVYGQLQEPLDDGPTMVPSNGHPNGYFKHGGHVHGYMNPMHRPEETLAEGPETTSTAAAAELVRQLEEKLNQVIVAPHTVGLPKVLSGGVDSMGGSSVTTMGGGGGVGLDIISNVPQGGHQAMMAPGGGDSVKGNGHTKEMLSPVPRVREHHHQQGPRDPAGVAEQRRSVVEEEQLCFLVSPLGCFGGRREEEKGARGVRGGPDGDQQYLKSIWIHCRLPLLLLAVSMLIIVFLLCSGAFIYFKYEPCETTSCAFGSTCVMENGQPICKCPQHCPTTRNPVCGSDDETYLNECYLTRHACVNHRYIRARYTGECDLPNPCSRKYCPFGSKCVASSDGKMATCECPTTCGPETGDMDADVAVCGSDGKLYRNRCELDKEACRLRRNITVRFYGKCDPCEDLSCPSGQICQLDEDRRPSCQCGQICPTDYRPVCSSDGKTYGTECAMREAGCQARKDLRVIHPGKCSSGNPCESLTCRGYKTCNVNSFGIAQCVCDLKCDPVVVPVCGSDGKTYDNECDLKLEACGEGRDTFVAFRGTCEAATACAKHACPPEAVCVDRNGKPDCECPSCSNDYQPVCGSDGVSYQNECRLRMEACLMNTAISKAYDGICNGCAQISCDYYSKCQATLEGAKCVCPGNCTSGEQGQQVCGSDGRTYDSECHLQEISCREQREIEAAAPGTCDKCAEVSCAGGARCIDGRCTCPTDCPTTSDPVCGSDLITYANECELERTSCQSSRSPPVTVRFYGLCTDAFNSAAIGSGGPKTTSTDQEETARQGSPTSGVSWVQIQGPNGKTYGSVPSLRMCDSIRCDHGSICELAEDGFPRCTCKLNCTSMSTKGPVCGSDLKLYSTECEMKREGCLSQRELGVRPMVLCEAAEEIAQIRELRKEEICYGAPPLRKEGGEEVECESDNCPEGSWCHQTATWGSKCCTKSADLDHDDTSFRGGRKKSSHNLECQRSLFGCCPDGVTPAEAPGGLGCPSIVSVCGCHEQGSESRDCDLVTLECRCKPGVGGAKCDRCLGGYWGLGAGVDGGCKACACSRFGSVREDCDQFDGKCGCKAGVRGHKCDECEAGQFLGPYGCSWDSTNVGASCSELQCDFGAVCEQDVGETRAGCVCNIQCGDDDINEQVCGSDGFTYDSSCLVRRQACLVQKRLQVVSRGPCPQQQQGSNTTSSPVEQQQWTKSQQEPYSEDDDSENSPLKSTRHLPGGARAATAATVQVQSHLGDSCTWTADCVSAQSICFNGFCVCREGYFEDGDRVQCKPIHSHLSDVLSCSKSRDLCLESQTWCFDHRNGSYSCVCPLGKSVERGECRRSPGVQGDAIPFLDGESTIGLDKVAGYHKLSVEVEITPFWDLQHGVVMFASQYANGSGDFMSVALIDGYVEFRYDLGEGPAILRSAERVGAGTLHRVSAKRFNRDGLLKVDDEEDIRGTSPGTMKSLNLDHGGYMGRVPLNSTKIWELVGTSHGFVGCVHRLEVGRRPVEFDPDKDPLISFTDRVHQCPSSGPRLAPPLSTSSSSSTPPSSSLNFVGLDEGEAGEVDEEQTKALANQIQPVMFTEASKLSSSSLVLGSLLDSEEETRSSSPGPTACLPGLNPCLNYGHCWNDRSRPEGYRCICPPEFTGPHCESKTYKLHETGAMLDFRGFSYLELSRIENPARHVSIELWLMPRSKHGIVLYEGQDHGKGDFIAVVLAKGHVQFLYDLGSGMANLTWREPLLLHKWHWIKITREGREATLQVNGQVPLVTKSPPTLSELNLELPLYIGGIKDLNMVHRGLGLLKSFDGVIQYLKINGETYHREVLSALRQRLVHKYEGGPCGASVLPPCGNGGTCFPRLEAFACLCLPHFSGRTCETRKETPSPVRFDGQSFIKFPRKINKQDLKNLSTESDYSEGSSKNENSDSKLDDLFKKGETFDQENSLERDDDETDEVDEYDFEELDYVEGFESYVGEGELEDDERSRPKAQRRNRIEVVFRTTSESSGLILWIGRRSSGKSKTRKGYLGLFVVDGRVELRIDLGAGKSKNATIIRSKVKVSDGRWHQVLIARQRRLVVLQVDGSIPQRSTTPVGSNVLVSDGRYWIGGIAPSVLPSDLPPTHHQGFVGCVDLVRIEKRRLPLSKIAYSTGIPLCEDDED